MDTKIGVYSATLYDAGALADLLRTPSLFLSLDKLTRDDAVRPAYGEVYELTQRRD